MLKRLTVFILPSAFVVMTSGCETVRYVPVERVRTDTVQLTKVERDSIYLQDSIIITAKGDTVMVEKWKIRWHEKTVHDTLYQSHVDSIPVIQYIDRPLTRWQAFCLDYGKVMLGASVILALIVIMLIVKRISAPTR